MSPYGKERRCTRPRKVQRNNSAESYHEITREDSGQEVACVEHNLGEEQLGFRKGRGTTDGMKHGFGFCGSSKKTFDTVPRQMAMATLRWMGAPESEVKMVEAIYENTTGRVV